LTKRGRGDFMDYKLKNLFLKSPFIPLFQRGNYSVFMFPCEPKAHVDSRVNGNPVAIVLDSGSSPE